MTSLCYIEKENSYLMLYRNVKADDENKGKWIGVGGKFEEGESPEECAIREIYEETGLSVIKPKLRGIVTFVSDNYGTEYMHLFTINQYSGSLKECNEGELKWIDKKDLFKLKLWEGDKIFLDLLNKEIEFFSLKLIYKGDRLISAILNGEAII